MKALLLVSSLLVSTLAHAAFRSVHFEGADAEFLDAAFTEHTTPSINLNSGGIGSVNYLSSTLDRPAFTLHCKGGGMFSETVCEVGVDPVKSDDKILTADQGDGTTRVEIRDPDIVKRIYSRIDGKTYVSVKTTPAKIPLLKMNCNKDVCRMFIAN